MTVLIATVKAVNANSYSTVAQADLILDKRLYADSWTNAVITPNAENYTVNGTVALGATSVPIIGGTGTFTAGSKVSFGSATTTLYTVQSAISAAGNMTITPGLAVGLSSGATVNRETANDKERALIWSTTLLDEMMSWYGTKRTKEQSLRWPRSGVYDADGTAFDYDTLPNLLIVGTCELGLSLLENNAFKLPLAVGLGVSEIQAGPPKAKIEPTNLQTVIPDNIISILDPLGYLEPSAQGGTKVVPLLRI